MTAKLKYIKYRPKKFENSIEKYVSFNSSTNRIIKNFRWKFAYNAIVNEKVKVRFECYKWQNIKLHLNSCKEYRMIYYQELIGKQTNEQKQRAEVG
jgi:hypothetical protein